MQRRSAPAESRGNSVTASELLEQGRKAIERDMADQPDVHAHLMETVEQAYDRLGLEPEDEGGSDAE